jgi:hypothetical protein
VLDRRPRRLARGDGGLTSRARWWTGAATRAIQRDGAAACG